LFFVVNGTTGEGCSLTVEERKQIAAAWCQLGKGKWVIACLLEFIQLWVII